MFLSSSSYDHVQVKEVVSAGSFYLANDELVRMIGLKAPDRPAPKKIERDQFGFVVQEEFDFETTEDMAFLFVKNLLEEQWVRLEFDAQKRGDEQVLLAYVYLIDKPDLMVNAEILRQGYCSLSLQQPNLKHQEKLRSAYQEARQEKRGIHIE
ncbi:MAG: thermonuclease family protein [Candidatus Omnitrophota bacterium]